MSPPVDHEFFEDTDVLIVSESSVLSMVIGTDKA